jgi:hypothetical protein
MSIIREQRENVIQTNNTAQGVLIGILEKLEKRTSELIFYDDMHGNLDFSVLESEGFHNIKSIILSKEGEITSISNLPNGLEKLKCNHQLLIELSDLPSSLEELDCQYNYIEHLELSKLNKLKVLQISNNHFRKLENLPESLEELYCNNNRINILNLKDLLSLRVLHCSDNKSIIIEHLPPSIVDLKSENNPFLEINYANLHSNKKTGGNNEDVEEKINYIDALNEYFKLKNTYEEKVLKDRRKAFGRGISKSSKRKLAREVIPKCIKCGQLGGTLFKNYDNTYKAICGNKKSPCNLNIELYNGNFYENSYVLDIMHETINDNRTNIIKDKLNTIFNFESSKEVAKKFKEELEEFHFNDEYYTELLDKNNNLYKNEIREEQIKRKTKHIYDLINAIKELVEQYEKDGNRELLKTAIQIQSKELNPEIHNLRILKYEIMEMNSQKIKGGISAKEEDEIDNESNLFILFQRYADLFKMEHNMDKPQTVVKFIGK